MDDETALMCAISMRVETRKKKKIKSKYTEPNGQRSEEEQQHALALAIYTIYTSSHAMIFLLS